jgi:hypothetical protein
MGIFLQMNFLAQALITPDTSDCSRMMNIMKFKTYHQYRYYVETPSSLSAIPGWMLVQEYSTIRRDRQYWTASRATEQDHAQDMNTSISIRRVSRILETRNVYRRSIGRRAAICLTEVR